MAGISGEVARAFGYYRASLGRTGLAMVDTGAFTAGLDEKNAARELLKRWCPDAQAEIGTASTGHGASRRTRSVVLPRMASSRP